MYGIRCKQCRRLGQSVCGRANCALKRRPYRPGVHGKDRQRVSEYGKQLIEKQKLKLLYGLRERQFQNYFKKASQKHGVTTELLLQFLEMRLDNVIYRLRWAPTRTAARQLVTHGHFAVNGRRVTVPSYSVKVGDAISIREGSGKKKVFEDLRTILKKYEPPAWITLDKEALTGSITALPSAEAVGDVPVQMGQIVEFYSR
jgi:small subunit ribosomal protein S4